MESFQRGEKDERTQKVERTIWTTTPGCQHGYGQGPGPPRHEIQRPQGQQPWDLERDMRQ